MKTFSTVLIILEFITFALGQAPDSLSSDPTMFLQFQNFMKAYNKTYNSNAELQYRMQTFQNNYQQLQGILNTVNVTNTVGVTSLFDLTPQEFSKSFLNLNITIMDLIRAQTPSGSLKETLDKQYALEASQNCSESLMSSSMPTSIDWRTRGALTPIRNQGKCGSCWAFSSVSNIQSSYFLKYGVLLNLSEQQLLDCNSLSSGCNGGIMQQAYDYLMKYSNGQVSLANYPYLGYQSTCKASNFPALAQLSGYTFAGTTNEVSIAQMLVNYGPLAVGINANYLQYYYGGIIDLPASTCNPLGLNHAVNLVGYGVENGVNFWIVRNSWGTSWGENGYFRIARGKGTCGINQYVITATIR